MNSLKTHQKDSMNYFEFLKERNSFCQTLEFPVSRHQAQWDQLKDSKLFFDSSSQEIFQGNENNYPNLNDQNWLVHHQVLQTWTESKIRPSLIHW